MSNIFSLMYSLEDSQAPLWRMWNERRTAPFQLYYIFESLSLCRILLLG